MGRILEECCWCGNQILKPRKLTSAEDPRRPLLQLLDLSPKLISLTDENRQLCSDCVDLVDAGLDYRFRLEEVKSSLKRRTVSENAVLPGKREQPGSSASKARLGQLISGCYMNCYIPLEEIEEPNVLQSVRRNTSRGGPLSKRRRTSPVMVIPPPEIEYVEVDDIDNDTDDVNFSPVADGGEIHDSDDDPSFEPDWHADVEILEDQEQASISGKRTRPASTSSNTRKSRNKSGTTSKGLGTRTSKRERPRQDPYNPKFKVEWARRSDTPRYVISTINSNKITRDQCLLCTEKVPESSVHFLEHNLERRYGNYLSCKMCLQAYIPAEPGAPTGRFIMNDLDHFKQFADIHRMCQTELQEAKEPQNCRFCEMTFSTAGECIQHEQYNHVEKRRNVHRVHCTLCSYRGDGPSTLSLHVNRLHSKETLVQRLYGCIKCSAAFWTRADISVHVKQHIFTEFSATDQCVVCPSVSDSVVDLQGHYMSHHAFDYIKFARLACAQCNQLFQSTRDPNLPSGKATFDDISELETFQMVHSFCTSRQPAEQQRCRYCEFSTMEAECLIDHEQTEHSKEATTDLLQYCSVCHLPCASEEQLEDHSRRHGKDEIRFFKEKAATHSQVATFKCTKCSEEFTDETARVTHMNLHVMDEIGKCTKTSQLRVEEVQCLFCDFRSIFTSVSFHLAKDHNVTRFRAPDQHIEHYSCGSCATPFLPSDHNELPGKVDPSDAASVEQLNTFISEHSVCTREPFNDFSCSQCPNEPFADLIELVEHHSKKHAGKVRYPCQYCSSVFGSYNSHRAHLRLCHSQHIIIERKCHRCWAKFDNIEELEAHVSEHGPPPAHYLLAHSGSPCLSCDLIFENTSLLTLHFQEAHDNRQELEFDCLRCSNTLYNADFIPKFSKSTAAGSKYVLKRHKRESRQFRTFTALCTHHLQNCMTEHRSDPCGPQLDPNLSCYICTDLLETPQDLAVHLHSHVGINGTFPCPICTLISPNETSFRDHTYKKHHIKSPFANFYHCFDCLEPWLSKADPNRGHGEYHARDDAYQFLQFANRHSNCKAEKIIKFNCRFCEFEARTVSILLHHEISKHTQKFPLMCDQCGRGCMNPSILNSHVNEKHKGILPKTLQKVPCSVCGRVMANTDALRKHMRVHNGSEPYVCLHCGQSFKYKGSLVAHEESHAGPIEPKFPCPICGKLFTRKRYVHYHVEYTHKRPKKDKPVKAAQEPKGAKEPSPDLPEPMFPCSICDKRFHTHKKAMYHVSYTHGKRRGKRVPRPNRPSRSKKALAAAQRLLDMSDQNSEMDSVGNYSGE